MRLLDHVAQCTAPFVVRQDDGDVWRLTGASDFAQPLARCPLRYVLADDLVRTCTALAYSEGDELSGCLDLLHIPAAQLWIEWNDAARRDELTRVMPQSERTEHADILRAGTLISAQPGGRAGSLRTFWLSRAEPRRAAAGGGRDRCSTWMAARPPPRRTGCSRDTRWRCATMAIRRWMTCCGARAFAWTPPGCSTTAASPARRPPGPQVIQRSLAAVVFDIPVLLALFLLMSIRADLVWMPVSSARLNAKRTRLGKHPLLEHIEVSSPLFASAQPYRGEGGGAPRRVPRFHHVRGHIVRRRNTIYWRGPHWRGHVRLGSVRTRTVHLQLPV